MSKKSDNAGNTLAAQAAFDREMVRSAATIMRFDRVADRLFEGDEMVVTRISVNLPTQERDGYLAIVTATHPEGNLVAFHGGTTLLDALVGLISRLENGSIKWQKDRFQR